MDISEIADKWAGSFFGTNTGYLYIEFHQKKERISGITRIRNNISGQFLYDFEGEFKEGKITAKSTPLKAIEQTTTRHDMCEITIEGMLTAEGNMKGTWMSCLGLSGTFEAYPYYTDSAILKFLLP